MPLDLLIEASAASPLPLTLVTSDGFDAWAGTQPAADRAWLAAHGFTGGAGRAVLLPDADGKPCRAVAGLGPGHDLWSPAIAAAALPNGDYALAEVAGDCLEHYTPTWVAVAWALSGYRYSLATNGRPNGNGEATAPSRTRLAWPEGADRAEATRLVKAIVLVRDLINAPANRCGPEDLAAAAHALAEDYAAHVSVVTGEALERDWPAIHAVGKGSPRPPRLIELRWGDDAALPQLTLVGKGVVFDTGGLNIKTGSYMKLMKKDMGGAAHALGLALLVMDARLPVRLRVLIPAVENSVSGEALRPGDVIPTRKGLTVEIGNTDAEGRVILADALAAAGEEETDLIVDLATLTGAARTALGPDIPALIGRDQDTVRAVTLFSEREGDLVWPLPLWKPYLRYVDSKVADLNNAAETPFAGAITAALFLDRFVPPEVNWMHLDLYAWNPSGKPGRPEGGEAQGLRALYAFLSNRYVFR